MTKDILLYTLASIGVIAYLTAHYALYRLGKNIEEFLNSND